MMRFWYKIWNTSIYFKFVQESPINSENKQISSLLISLFRFIKGSMQD